MNPSKVLNHYETIDNNLNKYYGSIGKVPDNQSQKEYPMKFRKIFCILFVLVFVNGLVGIALDLAPRPETLNDFVPWVIYYPAGFLEGLWNGTIVLLTTVLSFFSDNVYFYEVRNNGVCYNLGFGIGIASIAIGIFECVSPSD